MSRSGCDWCRCPADAGRVELALRLAVAGEEAGPAGGLIVSTWCPLWKTECLGRDMEARRIVRMVNLDDRRAAVAGVTGLARERLAERVRSLWAEMA